MKIAFAAALAALAATAGAAQNGYERNRMDALSTQFLTAPEVPLKMISYGKDHWQEISFRPARNSATPAPVVIMIFGLGDLGYQTSWMIHRLHEEGFATASIGYRTDERFPLRGAIRDIASAVAYLRSQSKRREIDPNRLILLGSGAGAQIAGLLATDPAWLEAAGVPFASVRGMAALNGSGFDVGETVAKAPRHLRAGYRRLFGKEPADWAGLSPLDHLATPNAPGFLFLFEEQETRLRAESEGAAARFAAAGADARSEALPQWREDMLETYLLAPKGKVGESLLGFFRSAAAMPAGG